MLSRTTAAWIPAFAGMTDKGTQATTGQQGAGFALFKNAKFFIPFLNKIEQAEIAQVSNIKRETAIGNDIFEHIKKSRNN